jgi:hypothetical protein
MKGDPPLGSRPRKDEALVQWTPRTVESIVQHITGSTGDGLHAWGAAWPRGTMPERLWRTAAQCLNRWAIANRTLLSPAGTPQCNPATSGSRVGIFREVGRLLSTTCAFRVGAKP